MDGVDYAACTCSLPCGGTEPKCPSVSDGLPPIGELRKDIELVPGLPLTTLDGQRVTNAVIAFVNPVNKAITVISDYGNQMTYSEPSLFDFYKIPDWYFEKAYTNYPMPTLEERLDDQIAKLQAAKGDFCV